MTLSPALSKLPPPRTSAVLSLLRSRPARLPSALLAFPHPRSTLYLFILASSLSSTRSSSLPSLCPSLPPS
eukprot:4000620-Pleurochrysis_carterae.AAC.1